MSLHMFLLRNKKIISVILKTPPYLDLCVIGLIIQQFCSQHASCYHVNEKVLSLLGLQTQDIGMTFLVVGRGNINFTSGFLLQFCFVTMHRQARCSV